MPSAPVVRGLASTEQVPSLRRPSAIVAHSGAMSAPSRTLTRGPYKLDDGSSELEMPLSASSIVHAAAAMRALVTVAGGSSRCGPSKSSFAKAFLKLWKNIAGAARRGAAKGPCVCRAKGPCVCSAAVRSGRTKGCIESLARN